MAEPIDRLARVNELLKREIAEFIERNLTLLEKGILISVTEVKSSVDMRNATVMISVFAANKTVSKTMVLEEIEKNRVAMQRAIAKNLKFKHTPVLSFKSDLRMERGDSVIGLLNKLEDEK